MLDEMMKLNRKFRMIKEGPGVWFSPSYKAATLEGLTKSGLTPFTALANSLQVVGVPYECDRAMFFSARSAEDFGRGE